MEKPLYRRQIRVNINDIAVGLTRNNLTLTPVTCSQTQSCTVSIAFIFVLPARWLGCDAGSRLFLLSLS